MNLFQIIIIVLASVSASIALSTKIETVVEPPSQYLNAKPEAQPQESPNVKPSGSDVVPHKSNSIADGKELIQPPEVVELKSKDDKAFKGLKSRWLRHDEIIRHYGGAKERVQNPTGSNGKLLTGLRLFIHRLMDVLHAHFLAGKRAIGLGDKKSYLLDVFKYILTGGSKKKYYPDSYNELHGGKLVDGKSSS